MFRLTVIVLLLATPLATPVAAATDGHAPTETTRARVVAVYPNPATPNDAGEFVLLDLPANATVTLTDGEDDITLTDATGGRVAVTSHPAQVRTLTEYRTIGVTRLRLANGGERLRLLADGETLETITYGTAPEASVRWVDAAAWRPLGATTFAPRPTGPANATLFVLPDDPSVVRDRLRAAEHRILLGAYTFTDPTVAALLERAARRGVSVRVLIEGAPVGGFSRRQARVLDGLAAAGVDVRVLAGLHARYAFHHAKYAVVDDRALVLTENWKPAGTGGSSSRGWGVSIDDPDTAAALAAIFRADTGWADTRAWSAVRERRTFAVAPAANGTFPTRFEARTVPVDDVRVLVAPDNAEAELVGLLEGANESIAVVGPYAGADGPILRALVRAARRGVEVRLLLASAWYVAEENRALADRIAALSRRDDLPFRARLATPRGRFEKIHAKGMVVDGETVVVGSVNWNAHSLRENREVAIVLEGRAAAQYYARVFRADWRGARWAFPVGLLVVVLLVALVAARAVSVRFVD